MNQAAPGALRQTGVMVLQERDEDAQTSLAAFQAAFDAVPVIVAYLDTELRVRFANRTSEIWAERPHDAIIGQPLEDILPPSTMGSLRPHLERALAGEPACFEGWVSRPSGARWVRGHYTPHHDRHGQVAGVVVLFHDLTEERRVQEEREALLSAEQAARHRFALLAQANELVAGAAQDERALERMLDLALPSLGDLGFIEISRLGGARLCKTAVAPNLPNACPDALCARLSELAFGPPSERPFLATQLTPARLTELLPAGALRTQLAALGVCSIIVAPVRDRERTLGALVLLFGPSGRQHTAQDLALAEELGRCAGSAVTQARLFAEAQTAIQTRDEFLSVAGHELRTPLTALQLQVQSIARLLKQGDSSERVTQRAEKAVRNVLRIGKLVDELLDVSRIGSGKLPLERSWFDLGEAVREVIERKQEDFAQAGCPFEVEVPSGIVGSWDRVRIEQVVTNLLTNAAKYGRGQPIAIAVRRVGERARISVRDSGGGIERDDQERIFQRFARGASESRSGGLGLGLWIARELVESHGGTIRVESTPGQGSCFEVELPLGERQA